MYNKYEVFNFISHSNTRHKHDFLGSCKIKFSRKILISMAYQTQYLLINGFFLESSYAYSARNLTETGNITVANTASDTEVINIKRSMQNRHEISSHTIAHPLENIADNSKITRSISTNAQGADSKTYRIKPAIASSKLNNQNQINKLNMSAMKWESELKSIELLKPGSHNSTPNPKYR